jgi:hypothetical protein
MSASLWRPGAVLGWGAPYGDGWLGVSAGAGIAFLSASQDSTVAWASGTGTPGIVVPTPPPTKSEPSQHTVMPVFLELAVHAKLPLVFGQQPFLSASAAEVATNAAFAPATFLGLDLGVVWND